MNSTRFALSRLLVACIHILVPATTIADERDGRTRVVTEYRVEYKLRDPKTGATGETHIAYVRARSEANVAAELRRQNPGKDVVMLSLTGK